MGRVEELTETIDALGPEVARTIEDDPRVTIEPPRPGASTAGRRALEVLERIAKESRGGDGKLELGETLGEGGMGVVRAGTQVALGRTVAVKTLRPEHRTDVATLKLLREAWVTGELEHPNVVPVYDVGLDGEGHPIIVLKRIEGTHWGDVMHDRARVERLLDARDPLEWNLSILMQVCRAVSFAHSRGIVHRDLKPENVMIGSFGEVYVLDWGIAVSLRDDGTGRFPLAAHATELAGTPCYMAPEMLGGKHPRIDARTDVYLLGAILHEILAGKPPHEGPHLMAIVRSVVSPPRPLPETVPDELAQIRTRAMDPDPEARFESVEQLRLALQGFLRHRGSMQLAAEARERLDRLETELSARPGAEGRDDDAHRLHVYNLFGECRFGFHQALRAWDDNEAARADLRRAVVCMVEWELAQGEARAASVLLSELQDPPSELAARVETARRAEQARIADLEKLGRDLDPSIGQRTRALIGLIFGVLWTVFPLVWSWTGPRDYHGMIGGSLSLLVLAGALALWARESMSKTSINRRVMLTLGFLFVAQASLGATFLLLGLPSVIAETAYFLMWFVFAGLLAIHLEPRFAIPAVAYLAALVAAILRPDLRYYLMSATNLVLVITVAVFWRPDSLRYTPEERAARQ